MHRLPEFTIKACTSYTPWEFIARLAVSPMRRQRSVDDVYDFQSELDREVSRAFKLYRLRKAITGLWFRATATSDLSGEMMFVALRRSDG